MGLENFEKFFHGAFAGRVIRNTLLISLYSLIFSFPLPIIFALLLNEIRFNGFKRTVQTITYMPYFISLVVLCGMLVDFCGSTGVFGEIQRMIGISAPKTCWGMRGISEPFTLPLTYGKTLAGTPSSFCRR